MAQAIRAPDPGWSHNCLQETRSTNVVVSKLLFSMKIKCLGGKFLQAAAQM